jgi:hypothetical protein
LEPNVRREVLTFSSLRLPCQRRNENALGPPVWNCIFFRGFFFLIFTPNLFFLLPLWFFFPSALLL